MSVGSSLSHFYNINEVDSDVEEDNNVEIERNVIKFYHIYDIWV